MKLLTEEIKRSLPAIGATDGQGMDAQVICKFFCPWNQWTWFVLEGEPREDDFLFYGYVIGFEEELGYFVLSELASARGIGGLGIERDLYFKPGPLQQVLDRHKMRCGG